MIIDKLGRKKRKKGENNKYLIWEGKMRSGEAFQSGRKRGKGGRKDEKWGSFLIEGGKKSKSGEAFQRWRKKGKGEGRTRSGEAFQRGGKRKGGRKN